MDAGCDILRYKDGRVTVGSKMPQVEDTPFVAVGVKSQGRPHKEGNAPGPPKTIAEVDWQPGNNNL